MKSVIDFSPVVNNIITDIFSSGGKAYLVGGAVRDMVMNVPMHDIDIEIHQLSIEKVEEILSRYGVVSFDGKSFGVFRVGSIGVDWSLPRRDSKGRKPTVDIDTMMPIEYALRRRDLTMNAIAVDLETHQIVDPFRGVEDIAFKRLKTPDPELFKEDPLRFYRVMQFVSRFEMVPDNVLNDVCMRIDIHDVSQERIEKEFHKMLLFSKKPSLGLRWIQQIGRLEEILPELAKTVSIKQNPAWHPEGSVFEHSMQALDAAASIVGAYQDDKEKLMILYAALCHDLGKISTTFVKDGIIKSFGHERETRFAKSMMQRITQDKDLTSAVVMLIEYHMAPLQLASQKASLAAYKRLAHKLKLPVSIKLLADLADADKRGRNGMSHDPLPVQDQIVAIFKERAQKAGVFYHKEDPIVKGADLLSFIPPGPQLGRLLQKAYEVQINEGITDLKELVRRVIAKK